MNNRLTSAAKDFAANTREHVLTLLHDDGEYRHVRFARPDSGLYRVDVVTWPYHLAVSGDLHGFVFRRLSDMFEFFRSTHAGHIDPGYWAEKVVDGRERCRSWSEDLFTAQVTEDLAAAEKNWPGLTEAWKEKTDGWLADWDVSYEYGARSAVDNFEFEHPDSTWSNRRVWHFEDTDQWQLTDWDWHYLRSCHAVRATIAAYDATRVPAATGGAA